MPTRTIDEIEAWVVEEIEAREKTDHPLGGHYYYDLFSALIPMQTGLTTMIALSCSAKSPVLGEWLGAALVLPSHAGMLEVEVKELVANVLNEIVQQKIKAFSGQNGSGTGIAGV